MPPLGAFGHRDARIGQRRAADAGQIDAHDPMFTRAQGRGDSPCRVEFGAVALSVVHAQGVAFEAARSRAIASTVAESRPPDSSTTARLGCANSTA